jgi:hypothetical protein
MDKLKKSFDFKLMMGYHISMMVLFPLGFFIPKDLIFVVAGALLVLLTVVSIIYKKNNGWNWVKPELKGIGMGLLSIVAGIALLFVATNSFGELNGPIIPWVCAVVGITYFNFLTGLNLADKTKEEFLTRVYNTQNNQSEKSSESEKFKKLKLAFKLFFFISWFAGLYLFYSHSQYTSTYSNEKTKLKTIEVESHGQTYYVNKDEKASITKKSILIIPIFVLSIISPLIMKFLFGIELM